MPRSTVIRSFLMGMLEVTRRVPDPPTLNHDHQNLIRLIALGESDNTLHLSRPGRQHYPDARATIANITGIPDSDQSMALYGFLCGIIEPPTVNNPYLIV